MAGNLKVNELIWTEHHWTESPQNDSPGAQIKAHIMQAAISGEEKNILLNYPVVYIHTWKNTQQKLQVYIGETIDILRRTEEHTNAENVNQWDWHDEWKNGDNRVSYYFSCKEMNKSLALDLEDRLIKWISNNTGINVSCRNGRTNFQGAYSNQHCADLLLQDICTVLKNQYSFLTYEGCHVKNSASCNLPDSLVVFSYNMTDSASQLKNDIDTSQNLTPEQKKLLLNYPVVYMHVWYTVEDKQMNFHFYTGEANDLIQRTDQHLKTNYGFDLDQVTEDWHYAWCKAIDERRALMFVFGHKEFNKSMTLDLENRLIQYMIFLNKTVNRRVNPQRFYNNRDKTFAIFKDIVNELCSLCTYTVDGKKTSICVPLEEVQQRSVFMASPLMELTQQQRAAKSNLLNMITQSLKSQQKTLLIVSGAAGTGKTVLLSSLFFDLLGQKKPDNKALTTYFVVNHPELFKAYAAQSVAWQLGQANKENHTNFFMAQNLINRVGKGETPSPDILLIDEGHLLFTQATQGSITGPQLPQLLNLSLITVLVFDEKQFVQSNKLWNASTLTGNIEQDFKNQYGSAVKDIKVQICNLNNQLRMQCNPAISQWLYALTQPGSMVNRLTLSAPCKREHSQKLDYNKPVFFKELNKFNETKYEIGCFPTLQSLMDAIDAKRKTDAPSALIATYSWEYYPQKNTICNGKCHWNKTGHINKVSNNIWTFSEDKELVGSVHDIQGFDLNYAGVIIGPVVDYTQNGIRFIPKAHRNFRSCSGPSHNNYEKACQIISNELGVLLSRGVKGIYLYATDEKLNHALMDALK